MNADFSPSLTEHVEALFAKAASLQKRVNATRGNVISFLRNREIGNKKRHFSILQEIEDVLVGMLSSNHVFLDHHRKKLRGLLEWVISSEKCVIYSRVNIFKHLFFMLDLRQAQKDDLLVKAIKRNFHYSLIDLMLAGCNLNTKDSEGNPSIMWAGYVEGLGFKTILRAARNGVSIDFDLQDEEGRTVLMDLAGWCGYREQVRLQQLYEAGVKFNPNVQNRKGETALMLAAEMGISGAVKLLLQDPRLDLKHHQQGQAALNLVEAGIVNELYASTEEYKACKRMLQSALQTVSQNTQVEIPLDSVVVMSGLQHAHQGSFSMTFSTFAPSSGATIPKPS